MVRGLNQGVRVRFKEEKKKSRCYLVLSVKAQGCRVDGIEEPPVSISNTEVKLYSAKSSGRIAGCEDRTTRCRT